MRDAVVARCRPSDDGQTRFFGCVVDKWICQPRGSAEERGLRSRDCVNRSGAEADFLFRVSWGCGPKAAGRVTVCVVLQTVAGCDDGTRQRRVFHDLSAYDKECGPCLMASQDFESFRRIVRIGAVVNREPHFFFARAKACDDVAIPRAVADQGWREKKRGCRQGEVVGPAVLAVEEFYDGVAGQCANGGKGEFSAVARRNHGAVSGERRLKRQRRGARKSERMIKPA